LSSKLHRRRTLAEALARILSHCLTAKILPGRPEDR
jgi:hypothetical protein